MFRFNFFGLFILVVPVVLLTTETIVTALTIDKIRAISFDVTGTLITTKEPVIKSYADAALWSRLPDPPTQSDLKAAFKSAFRERCIESPCFGGVEGISGRDWWTTTVRRVLEHSGRSDYTEEEFNRYFRRVYQHFGSPSGYKILEDADALLSSLSNMNVPSKDNNNKEKENMFLLGITSNTPLRHMESVIPMLDDLHNHFSWFTCSQEVRFEKPSREIFEASYQQARFWLPDIERENVLHIGDSLVNDYCGAKAFGFQALFLDRSDDPTITSYQDWTDAPEYPGKSEEDINRHTIRSMLEVVDILQYDKSEETVQ